MPSSQGKEVLEKRLAEVETELARSSAHSDRKAYQELAKEHAKLSELVGIHRELGALERGILDAKQLREDSAGDADMLKLAGEEIIRLTARRDQCWRKLEELTSEQDAEADRSVIVEIRAGTGGEEACLFAGDLYRMYSRYAQSKGWKLEVMDIHPTELGGMKEIVVSIEGNGAFGRLKYESGVHRVQRVPATEGSGRIHTSAVSVAVLPQAEEIDVKINPQDLRIDVFRATGPGGQGVNTTDSAVRITHIPTGEVVTCRDERSQMKNKVKAMKVLRARLYDNVQRKQQTEMSQARKAQIGTGDRSEKIRTYNFPDRRVTDHRIKFTSHRFEDILDGKIDEITNALIEAERAQRAGG